jgi:hypothetical protein
MKIEPRSAREPGPEFLRRFDVDSDLHDAMRSAIFRTGIRMTDRLRGTHC